MRLRNKDIKNLNNEQLDEIIKEVRKLYINDGNDINFLISYFDSTKTFMYNFLREHNIVKSKEQIQKERSKRCKQSMNNRTEDEWDRIKEKRKQTNVKRFGVENPWQSEEIKEKIKQDNLEKYGVEYALQRDDVKQKINESMIEKYGAKRILQTNDGREKFKHTCQNKYGVDNPYKSEEMKQKIKETNLIRYGNETPCKTKEIRNKMKINSLEKWGTEFPVQNNQISNKISKTHLSKSKEEIENINNKRKNTNLERYGNENYVNKEKIKESHLNRSYEEKLRQSELVRNKLLNKTPEEKNDILNKRKQTNIDKYGVPWTCMREEAKMHSGALSKINQKFANILEKLNISYENEYVLESYAFDFKVGNKLIEINPTYTHNSTIAPIFYNSKSRKEPLDKYYHIYKSNCAQKHGFDCIHVFDWDNWNKIISLLISKEKIYARKCEIREVSKKECDEFLNLYHLQNTCNGQKICLGLYYNDILIQIMTFGKPRYNKNYEWELLRLCTKQEYIIIGGSQKLFKHFLKIYNPKNIISYCDISKFSGTVYESLGMELFRTTKPAIHWSKGNKQFTNNLLLQRGADQLIGTNYGKGTSNRDIMIDNGWLEVYDCGQKTFIYNK